LGWGIYWGKASLLLLRFVHFHISRKFRFFPSAVRGVIKSDGKNKANNGAKLVLNVWTVDGDGLNE
jgi:hypothetical protein